MARTLTKELFARYAQCRREMVDAWNTLGTDFRDRHAAELRVFDNLPEAERTKLRIELRVKAESTWRAITARSHLAEREVRGLDRLMKEVGDAAADFDRVTGAQSRDKASRKLSALEARFGVAAVELAKRAAVDEAQPSYDLASSMVPYSLMQLLGTTPEKSLDINRREPVATSTGIAPLCGSGGWCWMNPLPQGQWLEAVWAAAPDDAWAVGYDGLALHWDGHAFTRVPTPVTGTLRQIVGMGSRDVWAIGDADARGQDRAVLRWDGHAFSRADPPGARMFSFVPGPTASVVAVGAGGDEMAVQRWDGRAWAARTLPRQPTIVRQGAQISFGLETGWASGLDDIWALGSGVLVHWNGKRWSDERPPTADGGPGDLGGNGLRAVWGRGPRDVWALALDRSRGSRILHFDGNRWSDAGAGPEDPKFLWGSGPQNLFAIGKAHMLSFDGRAWGPPLPGPGIAIRGVGGSGPDDLWAVGFAGIAHWDGRAWRRLSAALPEESLADVWGDGAGNVWMVGGGGLFRWNGREWSIELQKIVPALTAVWGSSGKDVWAAGGRCLLVHFDGARWALVSHATAGNAGDLCGTTAHADAFDLLDVGGSAANDVWAVGTGGTFMHWDGRRWTRTPSPTRDPITSVWASGVDNAWAAAGRRMLHWDGRRWEEAAIVRTKFGKLWGSGARDLWATGGEGEVHHWDGARWSSVPVAPKTMLTDIRGRAPGDVWAVAASGRAFHFDGRTWRESATDTQRALAGVWVAPGGDAWTAGERGTILRHVVR
ncbi:MAG TPA: hypothetical protein VFH68_17365 [Polyangia bacterium]|nr:hypothetical protein [Polyangia bacterium]